MKKHKKLLIRICSILACVLLVAGLALPCFALDNNSSYYDVVNQYVEGNDLYNSAYSLIMSNKLLQNTTDDFNYWLSGFEGILTGVYDKSSDPVTVSVPYFAYNEAPEGQSLVSSDCAVAIVINSYQSQVYSRYWDYIDVVFALIPDSVEQTLSPVIVLGDKESGDIYCAFLCQYVSSGEYFSFEGVRTYLGAVKPLTIVDYETSQVFSLVDENVQMDVFLGYRESFIGQADVGRVLLGDELADSFSPRSLLFGWVFGTSVGGGASEEDLQNAYNEGYNAGESVAFGEQLLGDSFKTPFEMLQRFTLFEWTDDVGNHHSINLAIVLGAGIGIVLFVWFLKLFAGG